MIMAANDPSNAAPSGDDGGSNPPGGPAASWASGREGPRAGEGNFDGTQRTFDGRPWNFEGTSHYRRRRRPQSPGLHWREASDSKLLNHGRVLVVNYCQADPSKAGMRKVVASEHYDLSSLQTVYGSYPSTKLAFRIFHIQNAPWATYWVLKKFAIQETSFESRTSFTHWVKYMSPKRRGGKALMNAHTWNTKYDPQRGISRTAFGLDYLKRYPKRTPALDDDLEVTGDQKYEAGKVPMMELNSYDSEDNPKPAYDVHVQRFSVYIQYRDPSADDLVGSSIADPSSKEERTTTEDRLRDPHQIVEPDNGNVIIIFDNSHSRSSSDTLIAARQEWESKWRRIPFYLSYEAVDVTSDDRLAVEGMKVVTADIFTALSNTWEDLLELSNTHVTILEDKVYSAPDDETRASELWTNNYLWLKVEKLVGLHWDNIKQIRENLLSLTSSESPDTLRSWLEGTQNDWQRLSNIVQEDLVKPTANLADLMYKSVGFRDSRLNLQLSTSVWRLTWIATVFLPLTFVVGFFGMHVDTFHNDPSIKWYFVVAIPLMVAVMFCWWITKHIVHSQLQDFTRRSVYSSLFSSLSLTYPGLWTPTGPRDYVVPHTFASRIKWRLIQGWANPYKTIHAGLFDSDDGLGTLSRLRRGWIRLWTEQLARELRHPKVMSESSSMLEMGTENDAVVVQGLGAATELLTVPGTSSMAGADNLGVYRDPNGAQRSGSSPRRSENSPDANRDVLVEEKGSDWLRGPFKKPREYADSRKGSSPRPSSERPRRASSGTGAAATASSSAQRRPAVPDS